MFLLTVPLPVRDADRDSSSKAQKDFPVLSLLLFNVRNSALLADVILKKAQTRDRKEEASEKEEEKKHRRICREDIHEATRRSPLTPLRRKIITRAVEVPLRFLLLLLSFHRLRWGVPCLLRLNMRSVWQAAIQPC